MSVSCGTAHEPPKKAVEPPLVTKEVQNDGSQYFEKDLYLSDTGEKLPINSLSASWLDAVILRNFRELAERADAIVIGKPLESLEEGDTKKGDSDISGYFSVSDLAIEQVLKGDLKAGDTMRLGQDVVISDDELYRLPEGHENWNRRSLVLKTPMGYYRPVKKGSQYILFLYKRNDAGTDAYLPIYYTAGRVNVDGTDELQYNSYGDLTISDQIKIQAYAIELYQAATKDPRQNPLARIVEQSDAAFVKSSGNQ